VLPKTIYLPVSLTAAKPYYPALTGLRALAAWLIFFYHFNPFAVDSLPERIIRELHVGVTLFFVLSGFLISVRYGSQLELSRHWLGTYLYRRFARIYPLYFLLTCLVFAVYQFIPSYDTDRLYSVSSAAQKAVVIGLNLTLLKSWFEQFRFTGIYAGWTLTVEEFFYLLAPFLVLGIKHKLARFLGYVVGLWAIGCALVALPAPWHQFGFFASYRFMFSVTLFGRCFEFLAGIYLGLLVLRNASSLSWLTKLPSCTALGMVWVASCIGLLAAVRLLPWEASWIDSAHIFLNNVVVVPGFCLLIYGLAQEPSRLSHLLGSRPFDLLGKASYAFYLIHAGILDRFLTLNVTTSLPLRFVMTNVLAIALYKGIEHPLYQKLVSRSPKRPS